ncbi:MAG: signal peptide peptidase SppA [Candidatus Dadabacteria bacterium]|nr:signal peptide peptidase SppA [Candidatus Dadabacteria bacterium]
MRALLIALVVLIVVFFVFVLGIGVGFFLSGDSGFGVGERVAVLTIEDLILDSKDYLESLYKISKDDSIKAVVIRINSPGGAVGPSQEIYSEIKDLSEIKPVVASIGTVGASGGYYIACAADKIFANPGSITGSIGVVAQFVSYEKLLEWAKLDVEVIKSGEYKDVGSPLRKMTAPERDYIQGLIDDVHMQFIGAVSRERELTIEEVNKIADGRIFTGEQAAKLKLIDELGTLSDAIDEAGALGGIEAEPEVEYYPKERYRFFDLFADKINIPGLSRMPQRKAFGLFYLVDIIQ